MGVSSKLHPEHTRKRKYANIAWEKEDYDGGRYSVPECEPIFKDLKGHMPTPENTRLETCPVENCKYYIKGFARKYDRDRHILAHSMRKLVCAFCPGYDTESEACFFRVDSLKLHLVSIHDVGVALLGIPVRYPTGAPEPPLGDTRDHRFSGEARESFSMSGPCSICLIPFADPQAFYEHLDKCVREAVLTDCQRPSPVSTSPLVNGSSFKDSESIQKALHPNELSKPTPTTSSRTESQIGEQRSSHLGTPEVETHHPEPLGPQDLEPTRKQYRFTFQRTTETQQAQELLISTLDSSIIGCKRKFFIAHTISEDASGCELLYVKARLCALEGRSNILSPKESSPATQVQNVRNNLGLGVKSHPRKSSKQIRSRHRVALGQQQYL